MNVDFVENLSTKCQDMSLNIILMSGKSTTEQGKLSTGRSSGQKNVHMRAVKPFGRTSGIMTDILLNTLIQKKGKQESKRKRMNQDAMFAQSVEKNFQLKVL